MRRQQNCDMSVELAQSRDETRWREARPRRPVREGLGLSRLTRRKRKLRREARKDDGNTESGWRVSGESLTVELLAAEKKAWLF